MYIESETVFSLSAGEYAVHGKDCGKQPKQNKMSTPFNPKPLEIKGDKGHMITVQNAERTVTRNASFFKKLSSSVPAQLIPSDEEKQFIGYKDYRRTYLPAWTSFFSYLRVGIYLTCNSLFLIKCCCLRQRPIR